MGPWRTFACDLPIGSIRPKGDVRRQQSNGGERRIPFSNWSRAEALRVSTLSGACVLCALVRRLMGEAGCRAARLKSQSASDWPLQQNPRRARSNPARRKGAKRRPGSRDVGGLAFVCSTSAVRRSTPRALRQAHPLTIFAGFASSNANDAWPSARRRRPRIATWGGGRQLKADEAAKLLKAGRSVTDIATALNIGRGSVYRALEAAGMKSASGWT